MQEEIMLDYRWLRQKLEIGNTGFPTGAIISGFIFKMCAKLYCYPANGKKKHHFVIVVCTLNKKYN